MGLASRRRLLVRAVSTAGLVGLTLVFVMDRALVKFV